MTSTETRGRKPITPDNPSAVDKALAKWISDEKAIKVSPRTVRAVLMYSKEFAATPERQAVKSQRAEELAAKKAAKAEKLRAQLAELEGETEEAPAPRRSRRAKAEPEVEPEAEEVEEVDPEVEDDEHADPEAEEDDNVVEFSEAAKPAPRRRKTRAKTAGRKVSF